MFTDEAQSIITRITAKSVDPEQQQQQQQQQQRSILKKHETRPSVQERRQQVTFATRVKVRSIPPISSYKLKEKRFMWYIAEEYATMYKQHGQLKDENQRPQVCKLGLRSDEQLRLERTRIYLARVAVFRQQQESQWDSDSDTDSDSEEESDVHEEDSNDGSNDKNKKKKQKKDGSNANAIVEAIASAYMFKTLECKTIAQKLAQELHHELQEEKRRQVEIAEKRIRLLNSSPVSSPLKTKKKAGINSSSNRRQQLSLLARSA